MHKLGFGEASVRLGVWNRISIVGAVFTTMTAPTWLILSDRQEITELHSDGHTTCIAGIGKPSSNLTLNFCAENWRADYWLPGWAEWLALVAGFAALATLVYGLLCSTVWIAKWVWRGRASHT